MQHICRKGGGEFHRFPGDGMEKLQAMRVKGLPADPFHIGIVEGIADERESQIFHMNSDLVE